jgi:hypothetical protein
LAAAFSDASATALDSASAACRSSTISRAPVVASQRVLLLREVLVGPQVVHDWRPLNVGLVLHLHRLLYSHTATPGGAFKAEDNLVVDRSPDGRQTVRHPVSARLTPGATEELVARYT